MPGARCREPSRPSDHRLNEPLTFLKSTALMTKQPPVSRPAGACSVRVRRAWKDVRSKAAFLNGWPSYREYKDALEEGARFHFLTHAVAVEGNVAGEVIRVRCVRTELGRPDSTGRAAPTPLAGSEFDLQADVALVAFGFAPATLPRTDDFSELALDGRGALAVDANQMTNLPGVFAGGGRGAGPQPARRCRARCPQSRRRHRPVRLQPKPMRGRIGPKD